MGPPQNTLERHVPKLNKAMTCKCGEIQPNRYSESMVVMSNRVAGIRADLWICVSERMRISESQVRQESTILILCQT
jgi:hypothetical protein